MSVNIYLDCPPYGRRAATVSFGFDEPSAHLAQRLRGIRTDWPKLWPLVNASFESCLGEEGFRAADVLSDERVRFELQVYDALEFTEENWSWIVAWEVDGVEMTACMTFADDKPCGGHFVAH